MTTFEDLGLSQETLQAIRDAGYVTPTPIQEQAIPYVLQMRDVLGCAQTGTGKTASFTLPMIDILAGGRARARMPRSLILEPTRELAMQVAESFRTYGKYHPRLSMALLIGGENMEPQIKLLDRGVDVLIATPGRLIDLFERGKILLNDIRIFVIDEADRMLDMGFFPDIEKISGLLPGLRQTLFFSATMPPEIRKLSERFLSNPKSVSVSPPATAAENVTQLLIELPTGNDWQKREALRLLLRRENVQNAFVFCNRKRDVALLQRSLKRHGFNAGALHGDMDQPSRTATLESFRKNEITFLICSDVAARGLDIADVSHVFNFDVPFNAEDYVHRIGRTGRAGKSGVAITLSIPEDAERVQAIEQLIKQKIPRQTIPDLPAPAKKAQTGRGGKTPRRAAPNRKKDSDRIAAETTPAAHLPKKPVPSPIQKRRAEGRETATARGKQRTEPAGFGANLPAFLSRPIVRNRKTA